MNRIWSTNFRTTFSDGIGAWPQRDFQLATKQTHSRRQLWPRDVHSDCMQNCKQAMVILRMRSR